MIPGDHDAIECDIALLLPVFPFKAYPTFHWKLRECKIIPIKRHPALVARALLRPYLIIASWLSGFMSCVFVAGLFYSYLVLKRPLNDLLPRKDSWSIILLAWGAFAVLQGCLALLLTS